MDRTHPHPTFLGVLPLPGRARTWYISLRTPKNNNLACLESVYF